MRAAQGVVRIQILHVPDCPLVDQVRATLRRVLTTTDVPAEVEELVCDYPSPTLLINGHDVTRRPLDEYAACRLDVPTEEQIMVALRRARG